MHGRGLRAVWRFVHDGHGRDVHVSLGVLQHRVLQRIDGERRRYLLERDLPCRQGHLVLAVRV
jgi:hypothetical protein